MPKILIQPTSPFAEYIQLAENEGYFFELIDFAFPSVLDSNYRNLAQKYSSTGSIRRLQFSLHGAMFDLYLNSPDKKIQTIAKTRIKQCLDIAQELQLKYAVFHTNNYPMIGRERYYRNWVKSHVNFWTEIITNYELTIVLENMWDFTPIWLSKVIQEVNSNKFKVCLDIGHCNVFSKEQLSKWFEVLNENIVYIHINDNHGSIDEENPAGNGTINWHIFDDLVDNFCNKPHVVIENSNLTKIKTSISFLKRHKIYPFK